MSKLYPIRDAEGHLDRTYNSWRSMKKRCLWEGDVNYRWYGGLGVTVCERWMSWDNFRGDMGPRPEGMTLDRIDPFKDYEPGNCRWATADQQAQNKRKARLLA